MLHFTKNSGQFHSTIAYVAKVNEDLQLKYKGAGLVELILDAGKIVDFDYIEDRFRDNLIVTRDENGEVLDVSYPPTGCQTTYTPRVGEPVTLSVAQSKEFQRDGNFERAFWKYFPNTPTAMASCHELCVSHGTASAALLNLLGDHA